MRLLDKPTGGSEAGLAIVGPQCGEPLIAPRLGRSAVVPGDCGDQWAPCSGRNPPRQVEQIASRVEQAQTTSSMVVANRYSGGIVTETRRISIWRLCLKLLGEFTDVVKTKEETNQPDGFVVP